MKELRTKIIACQTVGEELKPLLPSGFDLETLEYGFHNNPNKLHAQLQMAIDNTGSKYGTILFGYGLCSNAIVGLHSRNFRLVFPKADDCITLFLGSRHKYQLQFNQAPGTYYLTKGWIECGEDPYTEYCALREKYGNDKANRITNQYIANYTRLALITSDDLDSGACRKYAKMVADHFNLTYEEIPGSNELLRNLILGYWDKDFVIIPPGTEVKYQMFYGEL